MTPQGGPGVCTCTSYSACEYHQQAKGEVTVTAPLRVVFLDDVMIRHGRAVQYVRRALREFKRDLLIVHATDKESLQEALTKYPPPFDYLFTEHDFGARVGVDRDIVGDGADIARWITKNFKPEHFKKVVIHTYNPHGQEKMRREYSSKGFPVAISTFNPMSPAVVV